MTEDTRVQCDTHGDRLATFMCHHLVAGSRMGFHCAADPTASWPDAWCDACQQALDNDGEWTEESEAEADVRVVCSACYEAIRSRNQLPLDRAIIDDLFAGSLARLKDLNDEWLSRFGLKRAHQYHYDLDSATLTFSRDQQPIAVARMQVVGTYSRATKTWLWAWANHASSEAAHEMLWDVKDFGDRHGIARLSNSTWEATEEDGWLMAATAVGLLGGTGAYRVEHGHLWLYFALLSIAPLESITPPTASNAARLK